jgi:Uma2 family endonuclease
MGHPAEKRSRATYADYAAVPPHKVAELVRGTLHVFPRPAPKHANASTALTMELGPFHRGRSGPGGWWILDEPELHFPPWDPADDKEIVSPDIAGWRIERLPTLPQEAFFTLAPDWICEVLSKSTETTDREQKMPLYAREGVTHAWLVDPIAETLEVYRREDTRWVLVDSYRGSSRVRAVPFEAIEIDLSVLWS